MSKTINATTVILLLIFLALGCSIGDRISNITTTETTEVESAQAAATPNADGTIPSGTGVEKEKPAADKGNVQGKAMYNEKPAVGVEVKLCEKFSQYVGGCKGETFTTKTDDAGEYLIKDVPPGTYEGLTVKVFDTPFYVFATSGIVTAAKYNIEAGKTYFAPESHLFKNDLKLTYPKSGASVPGQMEVKWEAYPDAAYYKLSLFSDVGKKSNLDYVGRRVEDTAFTLDTPLEPGTYRPRLEAFNSNDRKLAETARDLKFTVKN